MLVSTRICHRTHDAVYTAYGAWIFDQQFLAQVSRIHDHAPLLIFLILLVQSNDQNHYAVLYL